MHARVLRPGLNQMVPGPGMHGQLRQKQTHVDQFHQRFALYLNTGAGSVRVMAGRVSPNRAFNLSAAT